MRRLLLPAVLISVAAVACTGGEGDTTTIPTDPSFGTPATDAAKQADEVMRAVPDGYADCGTINLTSGWPTTTAFVAEFSAQCINEAAASGEQAQQVFNGRDDAGGMDGTIIRVDGPGAITMITYHVDEAGSTTRAETTCNELESPPFAPPTCAGS